MIDCLASAVWARHLGMTCPIEEKIFSAAREQAGKKGVRYDADLATY
ncbi:MAG: hypothetical protein GXP08_15045 [Gammaproteobacteria bacterium]|nr:hypothetical protein [Gammaproteobacteria bacterium]